MPSQPRRRRECDNCGIHSFNLECLNCGGKLRPLAEKSPPSRGRVAAARKR